LKSTPPPTDITVAHASSRLIPTLQSLETAVSETISAINKEGKKTQVTTKNRGYTFSELPPRFDDVWKILCPQKVGLKEIAQKISITNESADLFYVFENGKVRVATAKDEIKIPSIFQHASEIATRLRSIIQKLHEEGSTAVENQLSKSEKQLFTYSDFPLGDFCIHLSRNKAIEMNCSIEELTKFLVVQRLCTVLETIFSKVDGGLRHIEINSANEKIVSSYKNQLQQVHAKLKAAREKSNKSLKEAFDFQEMITRVITNQDFIGSD